MKNEIKEEGELAYLNDAVLSARIEATAAKRSALLGEEIANSREAIKRVRSLMIMLRVDKEQL